MSIFEETLKKTAANLDEEKIAGMFSYYKLLMRANKDFNLTAIVDEGEAALKHFYDSIFCAGLIPAGARVLDVGTGAGFPGIPLVIARPDIRMTLMDSAVKKTAFVKEAAQSIGAKVTVVCARAEQAAKTEMRESFDVCVSRAVASLRQLCELCLPYVRPGGIFLAYKSAFEEEAKEAQGALALLGGTFTEAVWGGGGDNHSVLVIKKTGRTPEKYPRRYARILKNPL
jgi:16S rRNA (guanine527-N7)-methyltransferase